jgi:aminopeptidase YwaD
MIGLDSDSIAGTLDDFVRIGNRYVGTNGEMLCREFLQERFSEIGLHDVRSEPVSYVSYRAGAEASCTVLAPEVLELACRPLQYTASGVAEGEAVYLGRATTEDLDRLDRLGVELRGKVVLAHAMYPALLAPRLEAHGAAGFILIGDTPDGLIGNFVCGSDPAGVTSFPGLTIESTAGAGLIALLTSGRPVTVRVHHDASYQPKTTQNIIGEIPGSSPGQVIVGAHYDSQAEGPCIFDNASGVASVLEFARTFVHTEPHRTIIVAAFGAEEIGFCGSEAYARAHTRDMPDVAGMVNLDAPASAFPAKREIWANDMMRELAVDTAVEAGWRPDLVTNLLPISDHAPFSAAGIPACLVWRPTYPYYHSVGDTRELVDPQAVADTAAVSAAILKRLAFDKHVNLRESVPVVQERM